MPEHTPAPTPHRAIYGFAFYLFFQTLSIVYFLWALLPTTLLHDYLYLTYLPDKYFALCLPMLLLVAIFVFVFFIYPAIGLAMTPKVDALASVADVQLLTLNAKSQSETKKLCIWEQLTACDAEAALNAKYSETQQTQDRCELCHVNHYITRRKPIARLRFQDLSEMNKALFE